MHLPKSNESIPIPASPFSSLPIDAKRDDLQSHAHVFQTEYLPARLWKFSDYIFHHPLARGRDRCNLKETILVADVKLQQLNQHMNPKDDPAIIAPTPPRESIFFHLPYHQNDIPQQRIRQLYNHHCCDVFSTKLHINKFTIA
jgi:hypothetical protein